MTITHASAVSIDDRGLLIQGPSGSGKSDLLLRLLARGAALIADDQVFLKRDGTELLASPLDSIAGKIEVRGVGIITRPYRTEVPIAAVVTLVATDEEPRLPDGDTLALAGHPLPHWRLSRKAPSLVEKVFLIMGEKGEKSP